LTRTAGVLELFGLEAVQREPPDSPLLPASVDELARTARDIAAELERTGAVAESAGVYRVVAIG
jgi:hypothetical protein